MNDSCCKDVPMEDGAEDQCIDDPDDEDPLEDVLG